ncbi:hypothetical protein STXM2123_4541 [Streptomyces sp. F-3]|nr:hypothetical protein STXM2123_4541 [Streptomyces sp. F-3]
MTVRRHCAEPVKIVARELPRLSQLRLTQGPYRTYVLTVRPSTAADGHEAPGCSPVIGGFVLPSGRFPDAVRRHVITLGHRMRCTRSAPPRRTARTALFGARRPHGYDALGAT